MIQAIGDKIDVYAKFSKGSLIPQGFTWKQKDYPLKKLNFSFRKQEGLTVLLYYSALGETAAYELEFNLKTFIWRLTKAYLPGS
ncbi:MAG: hypothetical protein UW69_C0032G0005 [Microgenomates group bacterium GW2011_GWA2_44_7]|nr:MAG: hypothetical protein UW69_C0032G0005 [Microgenomates group bacterium GW2011_GWA2_44_7]